MVSVIIVPLCKINWGLIMNYELLRKYAELNIRPDLHCGIEGVALMIQYMEEDGFTKYEIVQLLGMMALVYSHVASKDKIHGEAAISFLYAEISNYVENGFKVPLEIVKDGRSFAVRDDVS